MAVALNKMIGCDGATMLNYWIVDTSAERPTGVNAGDECYVIATDKLYLWTGAAWIQA